MITQQNNINLLPAVYKQKRRLTITLRTLLCIQVCIISALTLYTLYQTQTLHNTQTTLHNKQRQIYEHNQVAQLTDFYYASNIATEITYLQNQLAQDSSLLTFINQQTGQESHISTVLSQVPNQLQVESIIYTDNTILLTFVTQHINQVPILTDNLNNIGNFANIHIAYATTVPNGTHFTIEMTTK